MNVRRLFAAAVLVATALVSAETAGSATSEGAFVEVGDEGARVSDATAAGTFGDLPSGVAQRLPAMPAVRQADERAQHALHCPPSRAWGFSPLSLRDATDARRSGRAYARSENERGGRR